MYICLCNGITDQDLEQAAARSKRTEDILSALGLGSSCGICLTDAINKLSTKQSGHNDSKTASKIEQKSLISN